jgi:hypothetical protein
MEFALYQGMDLAKETGPLERAAFSWSYTSDDLGTAARYLFEFDREDDFVALFEAQLCQFMWEAIFERPSSEASNEDLRAMLQPRYTQPTSWFKPLFVLCDTRGPLHTVRRCLLLATGSLPCVTSKRSCARPSSLPRRALQLRRRRHLP